MLTRYCELFSRGAAQTAALASVLYVGKRKIEDRGTTNFPEVAGRKLYGELTMVITVNHSGSVLGTEVVQTSGNLTLDRRAESIVRSLKFGKFNDGMRRRADQIVVVSRFRFTRDAGLQTQMGTQ